MATVGRKFETLIFLDLETSGLPRDHLPKITEISMCAISRNYFETCASQLNRLDPLVVPRVFNRLNHCVYPRRVVNPESSRITGLDNYNLQFQRPFDYKTFSAIRSFIDMHDDGLVCLIAHNGNRFDFPILKREIESLGETLPDNVYCADSLTIFRNLVPTYDMIMDVPMPELSITLTEDDELPSTVSKPNPLQLVNERTPERQIIRTRTQIDTALIVSESSQQNTVQARRRLNYESLIMTEVPRQSYSLKNLYRKFYGQEPPVVHSADADVMTLLQSTFAMPEDFWSRSMRLLYLIAI